MENLHATGKIRVYVVTWNMQARALPSVDFLRSQIVPAGKVRNTTPRSAMSASLALALCP